LSGLPNDGLALNAPHPTRRHGASHPYIARRRIEREFYRSFIGATRQHLPKAFAPVVETTGKSHVMNLITAISAKQEAFSESLNDKFILLSTRSILKGRYNRPIGGYR
jgi:hypothetical protein